MNSVNNMLVNIIKNLQIQKIELNESSFSYVHKLKELHDVIGTKSPPDVEESI